MSPEDHCSVAALSGAQSRRTVLHAGGALLAGMGVVASQRSAAAQATNRSCAGRWLAPGTEFQPGQSLPNTGRCGRCPYTVILWDAADRGFFFADWTGGVAGVVPSERVLAGIGTAAPAWAVLVGAATEENDSATPIQGVWALSLVYGSLGSDPGAVTYQGEPLADEDATSWLGTVPEALPEGPQDLGQGFLIVTGLPGFDDSGDGVRLNLT